MLFEIRIYVWPTVFDKGQYSMEKPKFRNLQYPTVEVPGATFHLVGAPVRVPTAAAMQTLLPTLANPAEALGPYTDEDPETEVVRPRHVQLLPCRYASILVHRRGVTPKVAYQELVGEMQAQGELEACHDVIVWLRAACTQRGGVGPQSAVPIVYHALNPVHVPPAVYRYMISKVRTDLPALTAPDALTSEVTGTLAGALRALTRTEDTAERTPPPGGEDGRGRSLPRDVSHAVAIRERCASGTAGTCVAAFGELREKRAPHNSGARAPACMHVTGLVN